jgi:sulfur dioxygenase
MSTKLKNLSEILLPGEPLPERDWQLRVIQSGECQSYVAWNERTREALLVDPKREDAPAYRTMHQELREYLWLGVIDTHTHADHVSIAATLAEELQAPLIMHARAPSQRVKIRVSQATHLASRAGPVQFVETPGHTPDAMCVIWGPFLFTADTVLFGDTGRDDLPGGDAEVHFESLLRLKKAVKPECIVLPGHDGKGGRATSWATALKTNPSLIQEREEFVRESKAFDGPSPFLLKESLRENFK